MTNMIGNNVLAFPTERVNDPYVRFKGDSKETDIFNGVLDTVTENIHAAYPDADFENQDFVLVAESILAMVMRAKGIEHPLNAFADTIGDEFLDEYI